MELAGFLVVLLIVCGLGSMVWNASRDRGLVVDAFSVPPDLAQTGMTGSVVANRLHRQARAVAGRILRRGAGRRDLSPRRQRRRARAKFPTPESRSTNCSAICATGWDTRRMRPARSCAPPRAGRSPCAYGDQPGATLDGADLDALIGQGAERLMAQALPYRYAEYLARHGRFAEALALLPSIAPRGGAVERGRAYSAWASVYFYQGDMRPRRAEGAARPGRRSRQSHALRVPRPRRKAISAMTRPAGARAPAVLSHMRGEVVDALDPAVAEVLPILFATYHAELAGDYNAALAGWSRLSGMETTAYDPASQATDTAAIHDLTLAAPDRRIDSGEQSERQAQLQRPAGADDPRLLFGRLGRGCARGRGYGSDPENPAHDALGKCRLRLAALGRVHGAQRGHRRRRSADRENPSRLRRLRAKARAHRGAEARLDGRRALVRDGLRALAAHPVRRYRLGRDADGARAISTAPSRSSRAPHQKGPHFADPLEMWGEALIAKNRSDLALAKFEEADKYAPNWGRLHLKWGEALWWAGEQDKASKQFATAARLDLTPSEKSELKRAEANIAQERH